MNLNSNNYQQAKKFKSDMTATTNYDDSSTIVKEDERKKLKRNNSFIAAVVQQVHLLITNINIKLTWS